MGAPKIDKAWRLLRTRIISEALTKENILVPLLEFLRKDAVEMGPLVQPTLQGNAILNLLSSLDLKLYEFQKPAAEEFLDEISHEAPSDNAVRVAQHLCRVAWNLIVPSGGHCPECRARTDILFHQPTDSLVRRCEDAGHTWDENANLVELSGSPLPPTRKQLAARGRLKPLDVSQG